MIEEISFSAILEFKGIFNGISMFERSLLEFSTLFLLFYEYLSKTFDRLEGGS